MNHKAKAKKKSFIGWAEPCWGKKCYWVLGDSCLSIPHLHRIKPDFLFSHTEQIMNTKTWELKDNKGVKVRITIEEI